MADHQDPSIEALRSTSPPASEPKRRPPLVPLLLGGVGLVLVVALVLQLAGGGDDGFTGADATNTTVDAFADVTTPLHTEEEFVAALAAANPGFRVEATPEETTCAATAVVASVGGPEALQSYSLTPDEFTNLELLRELDVPANAADTFLATAAACGFDLAEAVVLRHLPTSAFADREACIRERLDRNLTNAALAHALFDVGGGFAIPVDLEVHLNEITDSCAPG